MYDQLLEADLVVADITTLNFNAAYELGVRLALRPYATLVVGEKGMNFPFDINHIYIHTDDDKYWILATIYEACVGLGQEDEALHWKGESEKVAKSGWMSESTENQVGKLRALLIN
jgi:hypothetical protein